MIGQVCEADAEYASLARQTCVDLSALSDGECGSFPNSKCQFTCNPHILGRLLANCDRTFLCCFSVGPSLICHRSAGTVPCFSTLGWMLRPFVDRGYGGGYAREIIAVLPVKHLTDKGYPITFAARHIDTRSIDLTGRPLCGMVVGNVLTSLQQDICTILGNREWHLFLIVSNMSPCLPPVR